MYEPLVTHVTQKICNVLQYRIGWFCKQKINSMYRKKIRKFHQNEVMVWGEGLLIEAARELVVFTFILNQQIYTGYFHSEQSRFQKRHLLFLGQFQQGFSSYFFWAYLIIFKSFPAALVDFNWKNSYKNEEICLVLFNMLSFTPFTHFSKTHNQSFGLFTKQIFRVQNLPVLELIFFTMLLTALYCLTSS